MRIQKKLEDNIEASLNNKCNGPLKTAHSISAMKREESQDESEEEFEEIVPQDNDKSTIMERFFKELRDASTSGRGGNGAGVNGEELEAELNVKVLRENSKRFSKAIKTIGKVREILQGRLAAHPLCSSQARFTHTPRFRDRICL